MSSATAPCLSKSCAFSVLLIFAVVFLADSTVFGSTGTKSHYSRSYNRRNDLVVAKVYWTVTIT